MALIRERLIESAHLAGEVRRLMGCRLGGRFHHVVEPPLCAVRHFQPQGNRRLVGGDLGPVEPRAVCVAEEIVARLGILVGAR